jgi:hypothetical protein
MSATLEKSTYVERSRAGGTMRVQRSLNQRRAITLCCTANNASRPASMAIAVASGAVRGPSSVVGTTNPPMKPIA